MLLVPILHYIWEAFGRHQAKSFTDKAIISRNAISYLFSMHTIFVYANFKVYIVSVSYFLKVHPEEKKVKNEDVSNIIEDVKNLHVKHGEVQTQFEALKMCVLF